MVLGADTHNRTNNIAALSGATGELVGEQTVQVGAKGFAALVVWARELGCERVWAIEDCRHVSASLERFLIERGERVLRVHSTLTAGSRRQARGLGAERAWAIEDCRHVSGSLERFLIEHGERVLRVHSTLTASSRRKARGRGKSDGIDALAVARAALREGLETLPAAHLDGPELDLRLLVDHRERLVRARVAVNNTLQWHLHDLWPDLEIPGSSLFYGSGGRGSPAAWPAHSRQRASASPATSCAACVS